MKVELLKAMQRAKNEDYELNFFTDNFEGPEPNCHQLETPSQNSSLTFVVDWQVHELTEH